MNENWNKLPAWKRNNLRAALSPAQAGERATGVPACITLAQFILESNWGKSDCGGAKNYFGIKADSRWAGAKVNRPTREFRNGRMVVENHFFRAYRTMAESFADHGLFLVKNKRYAGLFKLAKSDYRGWASGLQSAGYATDPNYAKMLIEIIETYGLQHYNLPIGK